MFVYFRLCILCHHPPLHTRQTYICFFWMGRREHKHFGNTLRHCNQVQVQLLILSNKVFESRCVLGTQGCNNFSWIATWIDPFQNSESNQPQSLQRTCTSEVSSSFWHKLGCAELIVLLGKFLVNMASPSSSGSSDNSSSSSDSESESVSCNSEEHHFDEQFFFP